MQRCFGVILIISLAILSGCSTPSEDSGTIPELGRSGDFLVINGNAVNIYSITYIQTKKVVGTHRTNVRMGDRNFSAYTGSRENCERIRDEIISLLAHLQ